MNRILIDFTIRIVLDEFNYETPVKCSLRNFLNENNLGDISLVKELRAVGNVLLIKLPDGWILNYDISELDKRQLSLLCVKEYNEIDSIYHAKIKVKKLYEGIASYFKRGIITETQMEEMENNILEKYKWLKK